MEKFVQRNEKVTNIKMVKCPHMWALGREIRNKKVMLTNYWKDVII